MSSPTRRGRYVIRCWLFYEEPLFFLNFYSNVEPAEILEYAYADAIYIVTF